MPVGTQATVKALSVDEVAGTGARLILANTYHLMLRPGAETVREMGGLPVGVHYATFKRPGMLWWFHGVMRSAVEEYWLLAAFGLANTLMLGFAIVRYIGVKESLEDLDAAFAPILNKPTMCILLELSWAQILKLD